MQKDFFLKISKPKLIKFIAEKRKTRPRALQVYLAVLFWTHKESTLSLGVQYFYGRSKGRICYYKRLKRFIYRWTGLQHKQVVRYLRGFERASLIYKLDKQISLDGKVRPQFFLNEEKSLLAGPGEKFLRLDMRKAGRPGFDIYEYLERRIKSEAHPRQDPAQLEFKISKSTRWYRKKASTKKRKKRIKKRKKMAKSEQKTAKGASPPRIQDLTPMAGSNRFLVKNKTTTRGKNSAKSYQNKLRLFHRDRQIWVDWWKVKKLDTENAKVLCGLKGFDKAIWYKGGVYLQKDPKSDPHGYEFVPKRKRRAVPEQEQEQEVYSETPNTDQTRRYIMQTLGLSPAEYWQRMAEAQKKRDQLWALPSQKGGK